MNEREGQKEEQGGGGGGDWREETGGRGKGGRVTCKMIPDRNWGTKRSQKESKKREKKNKGRRKK